MKFKYSAFIENTPEMREWLEKLGYKGYAGDHEFIIASDGHYSGTDLYMKVLYPCVNCYSNPSLFKAVTAVREDSDKWQLFTDGVKWTLCYEESILMWRDIYNFPDKNLIHKATLTELKEHFNKGK